MIDGDFECFLSERQAHHETGKEITEGGRPRGTIDMLPDVALLEIFDFFVDEALIDTWYTLVHVCRRWRIVAFGSPRRLDLQLYCTARTPVRETLDVWPLLPIVIRVFNHKMWGADNIVAALEHNSRICRISLLHIPSSQLEIVLAAMQQQFPALKHLHLRSGDETAPVVPASFLGESAPCLQSFRLDCIPFPGLPRLLLTATHLIHLDLWGIPHPGYFSPEAIVAGVSVLTRLERLIIEFESPRSRPDRKNRRPPPQTRTLLHSLTELQFRGASEYLEDLVAQIDAPLLYNLAIGFFHQLVFHTPQLTRFISRTPKLRVQDEARVLFSYRDVSVTLPQTFDRRLYLGISCRQSDWQLSSLAQVCNLSFPQALIPTVEHLYILEDYYDDNLPRLHWQDDIENSQWLELLHPFTAVKCLYISRKFVSGIAPVLQELVEEGVTGTLPALQTLFLRDPLTPGPVQEAIGKFVAARQLANHPITVSIWERK